MNTNMYCQESYNMNRDGFVTTARVEDKRKNT